MKMRQWIFVSACLLMIPSLKGQYLYPEHYKVKIETFCLDCGNPHAMPPQNIVNQFVKLFNKKALQTIEGDIRIQILVDSTGKAQLLSADNQSNVSSKKLNLQKAVNSVRWTPAVYSNGKNVQSVQCQISFHHGNITMHRLKISFGDTPVKQGPVHKDTTLRFDFQLFNTDNSKLPYNMSRAVTADANGTVWMGTDNGLAVYKNGQISVLNHTNSPLACTSYDSTRTRAIMKIAVDKHNRKWISQGYLVLMYDDTTWTRFDSLNSLINWCTEMDVDYSGRAWLSLWNGMGSYENGKWSTIDSTDYPLPSHRFFCTYTDSRNRLWIGTSKGSLMVEETHTEDFSGTNHPITHRPISKICEDPDGNLWIAFYGDINSKSGGLALYDRDGKWHEITCPLLKKWNEYGFGDMLYDAKRELLWLTPYHAGLLVYDIRNNSWELYTPDNSSIPNTYIQSLTIDKEGCVWGATFGGFFKTMPE